MSIFAFDFVSDIHSDRLAIEITYQDQRVCQLYKTGETTQVELLTDHFVLDHDVLLAFPLIEFQKALEEASEALEGAT